MLINRRQISIRFLMLVVLLLSIILTYRRTLVLAHQREIVAISKLRERGFYVDCNERELDLSSRLLWLPSISLVSVFARGDERSSIDGKDILELQDVRLLVQLDLSGTNICDEDMKLFQQHQNLFDVRLSDTRISDVGMRHVSSLKKIRYLDLSNTGISDVGLSELHMCQLIRLQLWRCSITDNSITKLREACHLQEIDLSETHISDFGIKQLDSFKGIVCVVISNTAVTDEGVRSLKAIYPHVDVFN